MGKSLTENKQQLQRRRQTVASLLLLIVSLGGLGLLMFGTTPDRVGPLGITLFFILVFLGLSSLGLLIRTALLRREGSTSQLLVILSSAAITGALAIGTIELQIGDIILLSLFVISFALYWTRLR